MEGVFSEIPRRSAGKKELSVFPTRKNETKSFETKWRKRFENGVKMHKNCAKHDKKYTKHQKRRLDYFLNLC